MTVDPARRLADALGMQEVGNGETLISNEALTRNGVSPQGQLSAAMLDAKASWDDLVTRHAPDPATRERMVSNPLYRNITERFVQSHDYIAMERLHELHESGKYDLIVIDTPPANHAIDFLEAPARMADFFDSRLLKFLVAPSRSRIMSLTARPFLQIADRLLGQRFLADITEFFTSLETLRPGFITRAQEVGQLLKAEGTSFVVVSTLEPAPRNEAASFMNELKRRNLRLGAVVLNRTLPPSLLEDSTAVAGASIAANADHLAATLGLPDTEPAATARVLGQTVKAFDNFKALAGSEQAQRNALVEGLDTVVSVPWFDEELHNLAGLQRVGDQLWETS